MKQNFSEGQKVIIHGLGDGKEYEGVIRGKQEMIVCDNYIVEFTDRDAFPNYPFSCVQLIESCIKPRNDLNALQGVLYWGNRMHEQIDKENDDL